MEVCSDSGEGGEFMDNFTGGDEDELEEEISGEARWRQEQHRGWREGGGAKQAA